MGPAKAYPVEQIYVNGEFLRVMQLFCRDGNQGEQESELRITVELPDLTEGEMVISQVGLSPTLRRKLSSHERVPVQCVFRVVDHAIQPTGLYYGSHYIPCI